MKKPRRDFQEHRVRNDFLNLIEGQSGRVQIRMCMMAMMHVLRRVDEDEGTAALLELTQMMAAVGGGVRTEH
jgi:hypothetical protein